MKVRKTAAYTVASALVAMLVVGGTVTSAFAEEAAPVEPIVTNESSNPVEGAPAPTSDPAPSPAPTAVPMSPVDQPAEPSAPAPDQAVTGATDSDATPAVTTTEAPAPAPVTGTDSTSNVTDNGEATEEEPVYTRIEVPKSVPGCIKLGPIPYPTGFTLAPEPGGNFYSNGVVKLINNDQRDAEGIGTVYYYAYPVNDENRFRAPGAGDAYTLDFDGQDATTVVTYTAEDYKCGGITPPPTEPTCLDNKKDWTYTYTKGKDGKVPFVVLTVPGDPTKKVCTPLDTNAQSYNFLTEEKFPQQPNTPVLKLIDAPGTYILTPVKASCGQYDFYASFYGVQAVLPPEILTGPGQPFEPTFLHEVLPGQGPKLTYEVTDRKNCTPVTPPKTEVTPSILIKDSCGITDDGVVTPGEKAPEGTGSTVIGGITTTTSRYDVPEGSYFVYDVLAEGIRSVLVSFVPNPGYVVAESTDYVIEYGAAVWSYTFTDEACPVPPTTSEQPKDKTVTTAAHKAPVAKATLPHTGADAAATADLGGLASLLVLLGGLVLVATRRRQPAKSTQ